MSRIRDAASLAALTPRALGALARAGVLAPVGPRQLGRILAAPLRLGPGPAALFAATAARWPDQPALADEAGELTYGALDDRGARLASALKAEFGVGPETGLAIMCRNHRGFVEALVAGSRAGADLLLLNTDFPGPQLAQVLERERPAAAIYDEEFSEAFESAGFEGKRIVAWHDGAVGEPTVDDLLGAAERPPVSSRHQGRLVLLTSGTTGTPKGAPRSPKLSASAGPMTTLLSRIPFRVREPIVIAPPFFHGFGLAYLGLAMLLGATVICRRRFDAEGTLEDIARHRAGVLIGVPVMLQRILEVPSGVQPRRDVSSLRAVISAAAPLSAELASELMDAFGDVVYNLYGSTETGFATIATPEDLRAAPGTVGRQTDGATVRVLDGAGSELPAGETGRIFVGGALVFEGYTGGDERKEVVDGLMSTGDMGYFDVEGRLFVAGRDDDMIVSGGENVFPDEVGDAIAAHPDVADAAAIGVPDERFGQRLRAFVVAGEGGHLTEDDLRAHVKSNLARYKMPREFIFVDEIPRNPTGKVLRSKLREAHPVE